MSEEFNSIIKFSTIFKNLNGFELHMEDMELPVRFYNFMKRNGINTLEQLLSMSEDDLMNIERRSYDYIIEWLRELSNSLEAG